MNQQLPSSLTSFEIFYMSLLLNWHSIQAVTLAEIGSWLTDVGVFFIYEDWSDEITLALVQWMYDALSLLVENTVEIYN